jgi:hypothetical protein
MSRVYSYYTRFSGVRGNLLGLPAWARALLVLLAIPGLLLLALSIAAVLVSLLALLLMTVPVYRLLQAVSSGAGQEDESQQTTVVEQGDFRGRAKHVDATVRDSTDARADDGKLIE